MNAESDQHIEGVIIPKGKDNVGFNDNVAIEKIAWLPTIPWNNQLK